MPEDFTNCQVVISWVGKGSLDLQVSAHLSSLALSLLERPKLSPYFTLSNTKQVYLIVKESHWDRSERTKG